jgi:hypothetical protein
MNLKQISPAALPRALQLAEHYRLLNEPEQAESICKDVLSVDASNQLAVRLLLLSISDQFGRKNSPNMQQAQEVASRLSDEYERHYFTGVTMERWARSLMHAHKDLSQVSDWIERAMAEFEKAEALRPADNDAALLRWNTCARLLEKLPKREHAVSAEYGD